MPGGNTPQSPAVRNPLPNMEPGSWFTVFCSMPDANASPKVTGALSMVTGAGAWVCCEDVPAPAAASGACAALILDDKGMEPVGISRSSMATGLRRASAKDALAVPHGAQGEKGDGGDRATCSAAISSWSSCTPFLCEF